MTAQNWKLMPVPATEEMTAAVDGLEFTFATGDEEWTGCISTEMADEIYSLMLAVAPQPPALDGEPEVLGYSVKGNRYAIRLTKGELLELYDGYKGDALIELVDRAHVARLQVESENHKFRADLLFDQRNASDDKVGKLQARTAELEGMLRELASEPFINPARRKRIDAALAEDGSAKS